MSLLVDRSDPKLYATFSLQFTVTVVLSCADRNNTDVPSSPTPIQKTDYCLQERSSCADGNNTDVPSSTTPIQKTD